MKSDNINIHPKSFSPVQQHDKFKNVPKEYLNVATAVESQFAKLMLEKMKESISADSEDSTAKKFYNSILNDEHTNALTSGNGLGIKELVLEEIYPKFKKSSFINQNLLNAQKIYPPKNKITIQDNKNISINQRENKNE